MISMIDKKDKTTEPKRSGSVDEAKDTVARDAGALADEAVKVGEQTANEIAAAAKDEFSRVKSFAEDIRSRSSEEIEGVASAVRSAAEKLQDTNQDTAASYARYMAENLEAVSQAVRTKEVSDLVGTTEDFGRRQPTAFFAAATIAGFVATRFLLSSGRRHDGGNSAASQIPGPRHSGGTQQATGGQDI
jgi:hypothetical protein